MGDRERSVQLIPVRRRDTRMVGCTGDAQIIISNSDLEDLIVSVLEACDSPVDVRSLRSLVMSRLPVMDIYLVPIGGGDDDDRQFEPVDGGENPEESLLRRASTSRTRSYPTIAGDSSSSCAPSRSPRSRRRGASRSRCASALACSSARRSTPGSDAVGEPHEGLRVTRAGCGPRAVFPPA